MINSGNDADQHHPPPEMPPLGMPSIYSWVAMPGSAYRDFSSSRREIRSRFNRRLLLQQRVEASRKVQEQAVFAHIPVTTAAPSESEASGLVNPAPASTPTVVNSAAPPREPVEHAKAQEETLPFLNVAQIEPEDIPVPKPARADQDPTCTGQGEAEKFESPQAASRVHGTDASHDTGEGAKRGPEGADSDTLSHGKAFAGARWFALRGAFAGDQARTGLRAPRGQVPALAIFSQAGGVGKTSLAATLGRVLAARGEQIFLIETGLPGLLPFFFGSRAVKPGFVRTFFPPADNDGAAVRAVTLNPQQFPEKKDGPDPLAEELLQLARGSDRILIDIQTGSKSITRRLLPAFSTVLVPLLADMNSVMSLSAVEAVFAKLAAPSRREIEPVFLLNQFDESLPLHVEVRSLLQEQLGSRLLPFVVRRSAAVSEALAEGMTVVDYAPDSPVTEDYVRLSDWLSNAAPVAVSGLGGLRWSEH